MPRMSLQLFLTRLKAGHYKSVPGARRILGRMDLDEIAKDLGRIEIDRFFANGTAAAPEPAEPLPEPESHRSASPFPSRYLRSKSNGTPELGNDNDHAAKVAAGLADVFRSVSGLWRALRDARKS